MGQWVGLLDPPPGGVLDVGRMWVRFWSGQRPSGKIFPTVFGRFWLDFRRVGGGRAFENMGGWVGGFSEKSPPPPVNRYPPRPGRCAWDWPDPAPPFKVFGTKPGQGWPWGSPALWRGETTALPPATLFPLSPPLTMGTAGPPFPTCQGGPRPFPWGRVQDLNPKLNFDLPRPPIPP